MYIPPIRDSNGNWAKTNSQKAKRFAEYLEKIYQPNEGMTKELAGSRGVQVLQEDPVIKHVTPREVQREIKIKIKPKKSPGYNLISGKILRNLSRNNFIQTYTLLTVMSKLFKKLLLRRFKSILEANKLVINHQFGLREQHSIINQR